MPYIQGLLERLRSSLRKLNITVYFKNNHSLDNFVTYKNNLEKTENSSNLVILIKCKGCNKVYVGETGRRLKTRIVEHKRDCQVGNLNTGLSQNAWRFSHFFYFEFKKIKILAREKNTYKRRILESIFINEFLKTSINLKTEVMNINQIYQSITH